MPSFQDYHSQSVGGGLVAQRQQQFSSTQGLLYVGIGNDFFFKSKKAMEKMEGKKMKRGDKGQESFG